jgi:transposase
MQLNLSEHLIIGSSGQLSLQPDDEVAQRLAMLIEGQCEGLGAAQAAAKHGLSVQRYFQLLRLFREQGALALQSRKPGPRANYVRTEEVTRQVIRHRFLDPDASTAVIAQKMRQAGFPVSSRSVDRIVEEFGLQKKTLSLPTPP